MSKVSASPPGSFLLHSLQSRSQTSLGYSGTYTRVPVSVNPLISGSKLKAQVGLSLTRREESPRVGLRCYSSSGPGGSSSGDGDSKSVLDAFFLGKALAEALNERVESAVGEFLSTIGRLQAEQQKQIQEFQEDVFERAKKAKEHAAQEALEAQGLISKPTTVDTTAVTESVSLTSTYTVIPADTGPSTSPDTETDADPAAKGPTLGASNDD